MSDQNRRTFRTRVEDVYQRLRWFAVVRCANFYYAHRPWFLLSRWERDMAQAMQKAMRGRKSP